MTLKPVSGQLVPVVVMLGAGIGGLFWLSTKEKAPEQVATSPVPPLVETITLKPETDGFQIHTTGTVVPRRVVTLSAEVAGAVVSKPDGIQSGHFVRQGTPLLTIDPQRYQIEFDKLASELQQVDADLKQLDTQEQGTRSLIELAERDVRIAGAALARLKDLAGMNAAAVADLDAVERTELQAQTSLVLLQNTQSRLPQQRVRLQAQRRLTELRQQEAQLNLDRTSLTSPFDGVISTVAVEQGNYVQTGDVLLTIEESSRLEVACTLQMDDLYWLWNALPEQNVARSVIEVPPAKATVTWQIAGKEFHWTGTLARYDGGGVDLKTRTVPCRVIVDQPQRSEASSGPPTLMRGMFVNITLDVTPGQRLWHIPIQGVQPNRQVWTVRSGILHTHTIHPVRTLPDGVLVRAD